MWRVVSQDSLEIMGWAGRQGFLQYLFFAVSLAEHIIFPILCLYCSSCIPCLAFHLSWIFDLSRRISEINYWTQNVQPAAISALPSTPLVSYGAPIEQTLPKINLYCTSGGRTPDNSCKQAKLCAKSLCSRGFYTNLALVYFKTKRTCGAFEVPDLSRITWFPGPIGFWVFLLVSWLELLPPAGVAK